MHASQWSWNFWCKDLRVWDLRLRHVESRDSGFTFQLDLCDVCGNFDQATAL